MSAAAVLPPIGRGKRPTMDRAKHAQERFKQALLNGDGVPAYPKELQAALDVCTDKQRKFALLVAAGISGSDALRTVYDISDRRSPEQVASEASVTLANPKVSLVHSLAAQWLDTRWLLDAVQTVDWAVSNLYDIAEHAPKHSDRLKATELLLRKHGELVDRKVITHVDGSEADTQEALLKSILADLDALPVLETPLPALPARPNDRPTTCCVCGNGTLSTTFEGDGDGI